MANIQGILNKNIIVNTIQTVFFLFISNTSDIVHTIDSIYPIPEVIPAIITKKKNAHPNNFPPAICENRLGIVIKVRPGPSVGDIPKENIAGNIISPATIAIAVLDITIIVASPVILDFSSSR